MTRNHTLKGIIGLAAGACVAGALIVLLGTDAQDDRTLGDGNPRTAGGAGMDRTIIAPVEKDPDILAFQEAAFPEEDDHAILLQTVDPDGNFHFVETNRRKTPQGYNMRIFVSPFQGKPTMVSAEGTTVQAGVKVDSALIERVRAEQKEAQMRRFQESGGRGARKKER